MKPKKKGGGSRLTRSEVVTVRLDPKLRYGAELAARKQRRTASSFIEWAVEDALSRVEAKPYTINGHIQSISVKDVMQATWDVEEPDRVINLAFVEPSLLSHDEESIWKLIVSHPHFWIGKFNEAIRLWEWYVLRDALFMPRVRENWDLIKQIVRGEADVKALPDNDVVGRPVWPRPQQ